MKPVYTRVGALGMILLMRKRTISGEQWRTIISEQPASGLSIAAYCRQRRVPEASFYAWRRKLRDTTHFAEVRLAPEPAMASSAIELRLSNGRCVLVRAGFERQTLLELLATLEHGAGDAAGGAASGTALHHEAGR
jgi:transposase-like protein